MFPDFFPHFFNFSGHFRFPFFDFFGFFSGFFSKFSQMVPNFWSPLTEYIHSIHLHQNGGEIWNHLPKDEAVQLSGSTKYLRSVFQAGSTRKSKFLVYAFHFQVRWVTSHKSALERIWRNHKMMMLHLATIIARTTEFKETTRDKARDLKNYFLASTTMLLINFNLDVMQEFSRQSLIFQINDQSSKHRKNCLS